MASDHASDDRILACAIAKNLEDFDQLIDEMQAQFNNNWGGLDMSDAMPVLSSAHVEQMEHVVVAVSGADEGELPLISQIIDTAKSAGLQTTLVTKDVNSSMLHMLLKSGADGFVPYPMPNGALQGALGSAQGTPTTPFPANSTSEPSPAPMAAPEPELTPAPAAPAAMPLTGAQPMEPQPVAPEPVAEAPMPAAEPAPAAAPMAPPPMAEEPAPQPAAVPPVAEAPQPAAPIEPAPQPAAAPAAAPEAAPAAEAQPAAAEPIPFTPAQVPAVVPQQPQAQPGGRDGLVFPVYPLAGGVGASTFAANLAWEIQTLVEKENKRVCVLDFAFQYGSISTYLDVARSDASLELLTTAATADEQALEQTMRMHANKLAVFATPVDAVPLEIVSSQEIGTLIDIAKSQYDYIFVDLPNALTSWTEVVLDRAKLFFAIAELEMRSAQNALRFLRALKADDLPYEKVQFLINRAPKRTDLNGRGRIKRMSDSLNVEFRWMLPDGGKHVTTACDQGTPLAQSAGRNPLRKELRKIAVHLTELSGESEMVKAS